MVHLELPLGTRSHSQEELLQEVLHLPGPGGSQSVLEIDVIIETLLAHNKSKLKIY